MLNGLVSAIRTLSILPMPGKDAAHMSDALPWFPMVGFVLGTMLWAVAYGCNTVSGHWADGAAALVVLASILLTRGLHLDGLADWFDGLGGGRTPERILAIMKDSQVGAFGAISLVIMILIKWVSISHLIRSNALIWIVAAYIISRAAMAELAVCLPYARSRGGTAGPFVTSAKPWHRYAAWAWAILLLLVICGPAGGILFIAGGMLTRILAFWFYRRLRGITGDLLGTGCETIETGLLFLCALSRHLLEAATHWQGLL